MKQAIGNLSYISVRQFAEPVMDMINDQSGLSRNLLYKMLFKYDLLKGHDHKAAIPSYFDVIEIYFYLILYNIQIFLIFFAAIQYFLYEIAHNTFSY